MHHTVLVIHLQTWAIFYFMNILTLFNIILYYCYFNMELLYVDIYQFDIYFVNILWF